MNDYNAPLSHKKRNNKQALKSWLLSNWLLEERGVSSRVRVREPFEPASCFHGLSVKIMKPQQKQQQHPIPVFSSPL